MTQPGFFQDGSAYYSHHNFSESVRKKYSDKIRSADKWLSGWETLRSGINRDIYVKEITTVHTGRFIKRREKEILGLSWVGELNLTIRLPFFR